MSSEPGAARILIIDDEPNVRSTLISVLADEGYDADAVDSGEAGLEQLRAQDYDLVLLDIWLPGMDGLERSEEHTSELQSR